MKQNLVVSQKGIEIDPEKVKAILEMSEPRTEKLVRGFLGRLNYIARFISQLTPTCEPILKLLRKNQAVLWNSACQEAFEKIQQSLANPPVLMPPVTGRPLFLYMTVLDESMGCVLGQHDDSGKKEQAIYYLSKKFTACEMNYSMLERTCCALVWASDPEKVKAILEMSEPRTEKLVRGFLGRLNYIARFISQLTPTCEPILKLLRKNQAVLWNSACQEAFEKIQQSLANPPVLMPPVTGRPLFLYMTVLDESMGCVLGQHDDSGKKEQAIYYLSKKFTACEMNYSMLERTCCALVWASHRLRQYMLSHTTWLISKMDPVKYIFEKLALTGRIARWQVLLSEFDIVYVTQKAVKGSALADYLAQQPGGRYCYLNLISFTSLKRR